MKINNLFILFINQINVKQVFLLYLWDSLVTLELISIIPIGGIPRSEPPSCEAPRQLTIYG